MKYTVLLAATAVLMVAASAAPAAGASAPGRGVEAHLRLTSSPSQYVPGEVIVSFRADASRAAARRVHTRVGARVKTRFPAFGMQLARLPRGLSVAAAVRRYEADPAVAFAEPNYLRYPTVIPSDPLFPQLWALNNTGQSHPVSDTSLGGAPAPHAGTSDADIDAPEAWDVQTGDAGVTIAVIDTGVDVTHPDLTGQLWTNPGESCPTCQPNVDDDGNGKIDDVNGWDFGNNDKTLLSSNPFTGYDHGTHVAGTIAAALDDTTGVVGVCPGCKIMVLKIARDSSGALRLDAELAALAYAKSMGAKIANLSFGGPQWSNAEREAIRTSGLLAVVAAGNESLDNDMALASDLDGDGSADILSPSYPASYTLANILAVAASNDEDRNAYSTECNAILGSKTKCAFTNWGHDSVDLSAPGVDIESTVPGGNWETWDGTSMAAPHVAGVAGLVRSQNSTYTVAQLKNAVMRSVDTPTSLKTMYIAPAPGLTGASGTLGTGSFTRTSGRVNAFTALTAATTNATPPTDGNVDGATSMSKAKVSGSVAWPADINDVKKRRLYNGHTYRVTLVVPAGKDYDLYVWKPGTKEIWQFPKLIRASAHGGSIDEVVQFKAGTTGLYYLQVSAWLFKGGSYTLKIARVS